jgi:DNA-binding transcriptional MerR regulator
MTSTAPLARPAEEKDLTIGQVAEHSGVTSDTIRFYEREGLIPAPRRSAASYRYFPPQTVHRVRFIRAVQRFGLRLREIRELLTVRDTRGCARQEARELLSRRLEEVEGMLVELDLLRQDLRTTLSEMDQQP